MNQLEKKEIKENHSYSFLSKSEYLDEDIYLLNDYFDFLYPHNNTLVDEEPEVLSMQPNLQEEDKKISSITIRIRGE
ncbi:MAG: hypothetical protein K2P93_08595 [Alphaproteobacteria bacterium]|nr:hypothetical protein [Alphaproteobacteria bacterium]